MKNIFLFSILQIAIISCVAQTHKEAILQIDSLHLDAGLLKTNASTYYEFTLKNIGDTVAVIDELQTTCSGVHPTIDRKIIYPGESAKIACLYHTEEKIGSYNKSINVFTDTKIVGKYQKNLQTDTWSDGRSFVYLLVKGNVIHSQEEVVPLTK